VRETPVKTRISAAIVLIVAGLWLCLLLRRPVSPVHSSQMSAGYPMAPEFSLADLNGRNLSLSDYRGKVILLDFWATWCAPCQAEIPRFVEWQSQYGERGLQVIGISVDDIPGPVKAFYHRLGVNYPVALGNAKVAEDNGGILGLPINLVIDCGAAPRLRTCAGTNRLAGRCDFYVTAQRKLHLL
jgi:thiol-disulfide isomerase/thioredoxin